ncbi:MAG: alcohol dehydrogenase family protein [Bacteroidota bacterium]
MKALTFHGRENIQYESIPDPIIEQQNDVIVEVKACAICGSDLHPYFEREQGLDHGCAMGHEFVGEVVEVGKTVKVLQKGDRVMSPFTASCGTCFYCKRGLTSRCIHSQLFGWRTNQQGLHGGQAEWVRVPMADQTLLRMSDGLSDELGILLGDILSTGYFCVDQAGVRPGEVQVILGCGPVGMMAIWAAKKMGAERVFAVDQVPARLKMAESWGAIPINFQTENVMAIIKAATDGRGADVALEAVGSGAATRSAFDLLRPGGKLSAVGVCNDVNIAFNPVEAYDKNITYSIGRCPARYYMEKLMPLAQQDAQQLETIFSHHYKLSEGVGAYRQFADKTNNCTKVLLRP